MKLTVIINGCGGVGKDTLCEMVGNYWDVKVISSVAKVKQAAEVLGWKGSKLDIDRKFLSDLKELSSAYNSGPFNYLCDEWQKFMESNDDILFVMIREPEEIERFRKAVTESGGIVRTLLISRSGEQKSYGNMADDNVQHFKYDHIYMNEVDSLDQVEKKFIDWFYLCYVLPAVVNPSKKFALPAYCCDCKNCFIFEDKCRCMHYVKCIKQDSYICGQFEKHEQ